MGFGGVCIHTCICTWRARIQAYNEEWPLAPGYEKRKVIYNLYHILNHIVLFGGGYRSQAQRMIDQINGW